MTKLFRNYFNFKVAVTQESMQANIRKLQKNLEEIDKSAFIGEILNDGNSAICIFRPKGFLTTYNLTLLHYFIDNYTQEKSKELFNNKDLKINRYSGVQEYRGIYPVIHIDLANLSENETVENFKQKIHASVIEHYKKYAIDYEDDGTDVERLLKKLMENLYIKYNQKCYFLVNEFNKPMCFANNPNGSCVAYAWWEGILTRVVKGNVFLEKAVLIDISRPGMMSFIEGGFNNYGPFSIIEEKYSEFFGLTEKDIEVLKKEYALNAQELEHINTWCGGHQFFETKIFNPWSALNYIDQIRTKDKPAENAYLSRMLWSSMAVDSRIIQIIRSKKIDDELRKLIHQPNAFLKIKFHSMITYYPGITETGTRHELLSILVLAGFLALDGPVPIYSSDNAKIVVPNKEAFIFIYRLVMNTLISNQQFIHYETKNHSPLSAFDLTRKIARKLLLENITETKVNNFLCMAVKERLLTEKFLMYLKQHHRLAENISIQEVQENIEQLMKNTKIIKSYIAFTINKKRLDSVGCHPGVLHALAYLQKKALYIWQFGEHGELLPYLQTHIASFQVENLRQRIDLVSVKNHHFDHLAILNPPKRISLIVSQSIFKPEANEEIKADLLNSALEKKRFLANIIAKSYLNQQDELADSIWMGMGTPESNEQLYMEVKSAFERKFGMKT